MLEGSLHDFSLPDVLRLLAFTSKTGRLVLRDGDRRGRIDLLDGRVRDASADASRLPLGRRALGVGLIRAEALERALEGADELPTDLQLARRLAEAADLDTAALADLVREQTIDATFDLLRWDDGSFRFDGSVETRGPSALDLALGIDELLDETARRLDAWPTLAERTGPLGGVVAIRRPGREHAEVALPPDGWTLLSLVDGRRTLADLVDLCGQGEYRTRRAIGALVDEGVIGVGEGDGLGPGERLLRDHARLAAWEADLAPADAPVHPDAAAVADDTVAASSPASGTARGTSGADAEVRTLPRVDVPRPAATGRAADAPVPGETGADRPAADVADETAADEAAADEAAATVEAPAADATEDVAAAPPAPSLADRLVADAHAAAPPAAESRTSASEARVRRLRARVRDERLRTDPSVDEDLVDRLIAGVEGL